MPQKIHSKKEVVNIDGSLREMVTVHDDKGKILNCSISPIKVKFGVRDMLQVIVGATILAIPVGFTEETWRLSETLPFSNVLLLGVISILFIGTFTYYHDYRNHLKEHKHEFLKRVFVTYLLSFVVVGMLLTIIQKGPWGSDWIIAIKRIIIVALPASMSAAIVDLIK